MSSAAPGTPPADEADQPYESPVITDLGSFAELTRGMSGTLMMDNGSASQA